ncbi:MAG: Ribosomal large subunit pseudouridine synthase D [Chlamydiae bacterium]|nr:Ribosomal large subunit pseudouridine synthase D [Chlamydiota bacterium]
MKPIFCDNHLLVLEKPAGIATQPDFHEDARAWVQEAFAKPGKAFLEPIHRLDKPVSGIVLFARTSKALQRLNEAMRKKQMRKFYLAWVEGIIEKEGTLEHNLIHGNFRAHIDTRGKKAILHFRRLETKKNTSLVEIELETGRYHQIRAQFAAIGHPILGDQKYGAKDKRDKIALHHYMLKIPHPVSKEEITYRCPASFD